MTLLSWSNILNRNRVSECVNPKSALRPFCVVWIFTQTRQMMNTIPEAEDLPIP